MKSGCAASEKAEFVERLAHYYCEINMLHPFRLGNGIAQRIFFEQLALHAGFSLDWREADPARWGAANRCRSHGGFSAALRDLQQSSKRSQRKRVN